MCGDGLTPRARTADTRRAGAARWLAWLPLIMVTPQVGGAADGAAQADALTSVLVVDASLGPPPAEQVQGLSAVVLPLICVGRSALAPPPPPFAAMEGARSDAQWKDTISAYHAQGLQVLGRVDLLRWSDRDDVSALFAAQPGWFEHDRSRVCHGVTDTGLFVSIWHPDVRSAIFALAATIAERLPEIDGLAIDSAYSPDKWLGYSEWARAAYITEAQVDPIDLVLGGDDAVDSALANAWVVWREAEVTRVLEQFVAGWRGEQPGKSVYVLADPGVYRQHSIDRGRQCSPWLTWLAEGTVDGVLLDPVLPPPGREDDAKSHRAYASAVALLSRMDPVPPFAPVISAAGHTDAASIEGALEMLRAEAPVPSLAVVVHAAEEVAPAVEVLRDLRGER
jgi:hypothetical protein